MPTEYDNQTHQLTYKEQRCLNYPTQGKLTKINDQTSPTTILNLSVLVVNYLHLSIYYNTHMWGK